MNHLSEIQTISKSERGAAARPKTSKGQRTRQRQLEAAEMLFAARGYYETSIVDITQAAGVALGTFYLYFPDKLSIFREVVHQLNFRLREELRHAIAGLTSRMEIERVGLLAFFRFVAKQRNLYRVVAQSEIVDGELYRWYYQSLAENYTKALARAMAKGEFRRLRPESLAYCLMGIAHFVGIRWVMWEGKQPPRKEFETVLELLQHGLLP